MGRLGCVGTEVKAEPRAEPKAGHCAGHLTLPRPSTTLPFAAHLPPTPASGAAFLG